MAWIVELEQDVWLVAGRSCTRTPIKEDAKRYKAEGIARAQLTKARYYVGLAFDNAKIHEVDDDDAEATEGSPKTQAKAEAQVHLKALCKALVVFDEVKANASDYATLADKAMLFSESVTYWVRYDERL